MFIGIERCPKNLRSKTRTSKKILSGDINDISIPWIIKLKFKKPFKLSWTASKEVLNKIFTLKFKNFSLWSCGRVVGARLVTCWLGVRVLYRHSGHLSLLISIGFRCRCFATKAGLSLIIVWLVLKRKSWKKFINNNNNRK